jgi:hypothetical protein
MPEDYNEDKLEYLCRVDQWCSELINQDPVTVSNDRGYRCELKFGFGLYAIANGI